MCVIGAKGLRITLIISSQWDRITFEGESNFLCRLYGILLNRSMNIYERKIKNASSERVKPIGFHSADRISLFKYFNLDSSLGQFQMPSLNIDTCLKF